MVRREAALRLFITISALGWQMSGCSGGTPAEPARDAAADGGEHAPPEPYAADGGAVDAAAPDAGEVITPAEACRRYIAYFCARQLSCGLGTLQYVYACLASADYCPDLMFAAGSTRTVENVLACGKAWLDEPCDDVIHERAPKCGATVGMLKAGASCLTATQCESARCTGDGRTRCGQCIDQAPSGGACSASVVCMRDETCTNGTCVPRVLVTPGAPALLFAPGQACTHDGDAACTLGTACFSRPDTAEERCNYLPGPGERCDAAHDDVCWGHGSCDGHTCLPVYACQSAGGCGKAEVSVCPNADCHITWCAPLRQEGESCSPPVVPCAERLECVQGVCKRANLPGRFEQTCK